MNLSERISIAATDGERPRHGNAGRPKSAEHRAKISAANRLRAPISDETRAKMSQAGRGRLKSAEHRAKIGAAQRGMKYPNRKPCTIETKMKRSAALKGREITAEWRQKISAALTGRKVVFSAQHCANLSAATKGKPKTPAHRAKIAVLALAACIKQGLKKPTRIEIAVAELLRGLEIKFVQQQPIGRYAVDFFLPHVRLVIECDGTYWHSRPGAAEKDRRKDAFLLGAGYPVLRLPESLIKNGPVAETIRTAVAALEMAS